MKQNQSGGLACRFRALPRPFAIALLVVPAGLAVSALGLPALASASVGQSADAGNTAVTRQAAAKKLLLQKLAAQKQSAHPAAIPAAPATAADKDLAAYFRAGYGYDDAVLLSRLWISATPYDAKVSAGAKLLHHIVLPIKPGQTAWQVAKDVALAAFSSNGYTYGDAVKLATLWHTGTSATALGNVKVMAGRKLLAGALPSHRATAPAPDPTPEPTSAPVTLPPEIVAAADAELRAYFAAGYTYNDAVLLSKFWDKGATPYQEKLLAGNKLLHHLPMPIKPGQTAAQVSDDVAVAAYFAYGYDYTDALKLAAIWKIATPGGDVTGVKVTAGRKLLAGLTLPVHA
jgi:hypothetical protein